MSSLLPNRRTVPHAGLSLIELMIVVTLIGIIAAIVVPRVSITTERSSDTVEAHHLAQLNSLVEQFYLETGAWPTAVSDLTTDYLPDGVPSHPHGGTYTINATSHRVEVTP